MRIQNPVRVYLKKEVFPKFTFNLDMLKYKTTLQHQPQNHNGACMTCYP